VHPTDPLMFSASADGTLCAWKYDDEDADSSIKFTFTHIDSVTAERAIPTSVAVLGSDTHKLVVCYNNGDVAIVDAYTGRLVSHAKPAADASADSASGASASKHALAVCTHPTLGLALTANADQCVRFYDIKQSSCVAVLRAHRDAVTSVAIEPSLGTQCATASHDQMVRFWDLGTRKIVQNLEPHQTHQKKFDEAVHCVVYHPTLSMVAHGGADSLVKVLPQT